jgi:hypothetical protein
MMQEWIAGLETQLAQKNAEVERLRRLVQTMIDEDPNDFAADAVTVLEVWREEARKALAR